MSPHALTMHGGDCRRPPVAPSCHSHRPSALALGLITEGSIAGEAATSVMGAGRVPPVILRRAWTASHWLVARGLTPCFMARWLLLGWHLLTHRPTPNPTEGALAKRVRIQQFQETPREELPWAVSRE